ncbi:probable palmitoyltransferase ZDHHC24 [Dermacentor albipictus]|uniref:probable palmitoyltransferase ZDHHC24 n=2 Tax=Dermacentor TaxID=34619 RepID=UPI0038FCD9BA
MTVRTTPMESTLQQQGVMDVRGPPLSRRCIVPRGYRDRVLFMLMMCGIPLIVFFNFCFVAPRYHETFDKVMWVHAALATFIVFNIYANLFKLFQTDTSARDMKTPAVLLPGWRHCAVCLMNVPPRSHHCSVCNECILKHDHHCMFTGRCIGFYNQRYFVVALLYMTVGLFYSLSYKCPYVLEMLGGINLATFLHMVAPHFGLLLGFVDVWLFLCNLVNLVELVVFFLCAYLLMVELICVARNQTTYEKSHGIRTYSMGLRRNLKETLGASWFLVWLSPWVQSPVSGDGLHFDGHVVCMDGKKQE